MGRGPRCVHCVRALGCAARASPSPQQSRCRVGWKQVEGCVNIGGVYQCWGMETDKWEACPADLLQAQVGVRAGGGGQTRGRLHERREPGVTRPGSLLPWSAAYGRGPWSGGCQRRAALRSFAVPPHHQRRALPAAHRARCEHPRRRHAAAEGWFQQRHRLVSSSLPPLRPSLPFLQGELMADCVQREGAWSCLSATSGDWQQCDMGPPQAIVSDQGQLLVAQVSSIPPLTSQAASNLAQAGQPLASQGLQGCPRRYPCCSATPPAAAPASCRPCTAAASSTTASTTATPRQAPPKSAPRRQAAL